jgi:hypothetical protein
MATRALAYFIRREHAWKVSAGDSEGFVPPKLTEPEGADADGDVAMLDLSANRKLGAALTDPSAGGRSAGSLHGAVLEDLLLWLTLHRWCTLP